MLSWLGDALGRAADFVGSGLADARDKIVFGGFFNLHTPERNQTSDLGWSQDHPASPELGERSVLEAFYDRLGPAERAEHFREPPQQSHGIER